MDLFGPTFVKSLSKKSYCLVITNDYSRFSWVFFLATKDETASVLKAFIVGLENLLSLKVKIIKCDNGTEFKNADLHQFYGIKGIKREFSVPRTPQQNGIDERKNRTLIEAAVGNKMHKAFPLLEESSHWQYNFPLPVEGVLTARRMEIPLLKSLHCYDEETANSLLPISFWAEAVNTDCYVKNRVLVTKPHNKTPYELLHGRTPSIGFMRPFGCLVTIFNTLDSLGKFNGKVDEGFLVGYSVSKLEDIIYSDHEDDVGVEADFNNLETSITVSYIPTSRVHKNHPVTQIIGDLSSITQTRSMTKVVKDQEVYVCQPPGFEDPVHSDKVYKVVKALYGLHQAPRAWYETLANYLMENGFQR
nr:hypothetical protein [Tanacetum cinerariifolium]